MLPWQVEEQETWTGSGFDVRVGADVFILTNAHVVENAFYVRITRQHSATKYRAQVVCVAHDLDLALLRILGSSSGDPSSSPTTAAQLAHTLPSLFSTVHALGYGEGGKTVCVTKGIVSRVDAQIYAQASSKGFTELTAAFSGRLLILQIDAAINAGNSGGPALSADGLVVGVASSGMSHAQNVGYIIPSSLVRLFLEDWEQHGSWRGVSEVGFAIRALESPALRRFYATTDNIGCLVTSVAPLGPWYGVLEEEDVLLAIDEHDVYSDGSALLPGGKVLLHLDHFITSKPRGTCVNLTILRRGEGLVVSCNTSSIPPLLPRYVNLDAHPSYFIVGGLVFTRLSMPLLHELLSSLDENDALRSGMLLREAQRWREHLDEEVVILLTVLRHDVNEDIRADTGLRIVTQVNDQPVASLSALVRATMSIISGELTEYLRFCFNVDHKSKYMGAARSEVLVVEDILTADKQILEQNGISLPFSIDLFDVFRASTNRGNATTENWCNLARARSEGDGTRRKRSRDAVMPSVFE
jgi:S1-C subfamily serine protease